MTKPANDFATPTVKQSVDRTKPGLPEAQGLYDPRNERDACGIGFVANIKGVKTHKIVEQGLEILVNLTHRGAVGADPKAGDGSGLLIQIPDAFMRTKTAELGIELPAEGTYVPTDNGNFSDGIKQTEPVIRQLFVAQGDNIADQDAFERKLYVIRKLVSNTISSWNDDINDWYYVPSFSSRVVLYKGILLANQVGPYYPDLSAESMVSALALEVRQASSGEAGAVGAFRKVAKQHLPFVQLFLVRLGAGEFCLDFGIVNDAAFNCIDQQHLAGLQAPFLNNVFFSDGQHAGFRRQNNHVILGNVIARRAQAVTVERCADLDTITKGNGCRAIPWLHDSCMIFIESAAFVIHQWVAGPRFWDQHHHGVRQRVSTVQQQFQRIIKTRRIRLVFRDQWPQFVEVIAEQL